MKELHVTLKNAAKTGKQPANEEVRLSLVVSPELNERLEEMAKSAYTTKSEILRKAIALFDVVAEAKSKKQRLGILDSDRKLITEIVGI
jgi:predicted transcriptional regulator